MFSGEKATYLTVQDEAEYRAETVLHAESCMSSPIQSTILSYFLFILQDLKSVDCSVKMKL